MKQVYKAVSKDGKKFTIGWDGHHHHAVDEAGQPVGTPKMSLAASLNMINAELVGEPSAPAAQEGQDKAPAATEEQEAAGPEEPSEGSHEDVVAQVDGSMDDKPAPAATKGQEAAAPAAQEQGGLNVPPAPAQPKPAAQKKNGRK